jgi:enoyl-CoA hydratase
MTATYSQLQVARSATGVVTVTLDNPTRRNAMSAPMTASWAALMAELRADRGVRAVVVTGAGTAFCSGGDTGWIGSEPDAGVDQLRARMMPFYRTWLAIRDLEVPTIAAVNGPAVGAGLCLALACDLRYAAEDARLAVPFTRLGMHAGMAATWTLPEVAGLGLAREMLLTGRSLTGVEAAAAGLVNRAYPAGELAAAVAGIAEEVAACAPIATRLTKLALASGGHADFDSALQWEALAQPVTLATADLQEGLAAQRERRPPAFEGR